jgi:hypothetical protein
MPSNALPETEFYLNKETGDIYIINYEENRPSNTYVWVRISRTCYDVLTKNMWKRLKGEI